MHDVNIILAQDPNFNFVGVQFRDSTHSATDPWVEPDYNPPPAFDSHGHTRKKKKPNGQKVYYYKTFENFDIGDFAIVDSPSSGLVIVEVVEINCLLKVEGNKYKWIIQRIDPTIYQDSLAREEKVIEYLNQSRLNKLRKEHFEQLTEEMTDAQKNELIGVAKGVIMEDDNDETEKQSPEPETQPEGQL